MVPVEIIKPVTTGGKTYERGEIVDAQGWRMLNSMYRAGQVRPYVSPELLAQKSDLPAMKGKRDGIRSAN